MFDFDLTLVDSSYVIVKCTNLLAEEKGLRKVSREEMLATIGLPLDESWRSFWGEIDPDWIDTYRKYYRHYERLELRDLPGTREIPALLRESGLKIGVVSNRQYARLGVAAARMDGVFDVVIGLEDVTHAKPHPEPLLTALSRIGVAPGHAIYVGDTDIDMKTAIAAGVRPVGVTTGNFGEQALCQAGAVRVCDSLLELPEFLGLQATL